MTHEGKVLPNLILWNWIFSIPHMCNNIEYHWASDHVQWEVTYCAPSQHFPYWGNTKHFRWRHLQKRNQLTLNERGALHVPIHTWIEELYKTNINMLPIFWHVYSFIVYYLCQANQFKVFPKNSIISDSYTAVIT